MRLIILAAVLPALAACSTTTPEERLANNQASCQAYGFKAGTDGYANCMMQRDFADRAEDAAVREDIAAGLRQAGANIAAENARRPVTCSSRGSARATGYGTVYGNSTTTCY